MKEVAKQASQFQKVGKDVALSINQVSLEPVLTRRDHLKRVLLLVIIVLLVGGTVGFIVHQESKDVSNSKLPLSDAIKNGLTLKQPKRVTSLLAFVREGDIWIGSIDGNELKQITSHSEIKYERQHVMNDTPWQIDETNNYAKFPRISFDGKYLAYIALTQESIDGITERTRRIATESAQVKSEGKSDIFLYPPRYYALHIYNIKEQKEEKLDYYQGTSEDIVGHFKSLTWAANRNALFIIRDNNLQMVIDNYADKDKPLTHTVVLKDFCDWYCNQIHEPSQIISIKPDGSQMAGTYFTGNNCNAYREYKLFTVNLKTGQISKQPEDLSSCIPRIGSWLNDGFLAVEEDEYGSVFYKYGASDWSQKEKLFVDYDYQDRGPVQSSPNGKYVAYPVGSLSYGSSGKLDMRIRNLENLEFVDILHHLKQEGDKIFYAKWDSETKYLYFILIDEKSGASNFVRYDNVSKEVHVVVNDVFDADIN